MIRPSRHPSSFVSASLALFSLGALSLPVVASAAFENGANAIDLLGQYDQTNFTDPVPVYTKSGANDGANKFGFNSAPFLAYDGIGNRLFVADSSNARVLVYAMNANGTFVDHLPDNVLGQPNFYSNTEVAAQNGIIGLQAIEYDSTNNRLFVAGGNGNRVTVYDVTSIIDGENATNVLGQPNYTASAASTQQNGLNVPRALVYDSTNNRLFVAQSGANRVTVYDVHSITDGQNATNVLGQPNYTTGTAATQQNGMNNPGGLAYDSANSRLFVALGTSRVLVYDVTSITDGQNAANILGQSNFTANTPATQQNGMNTAKGLAFDSVNNRLFVADQGISRVLVYNVASITNGQNATNVLGQPNFTSLGGSAQQNRLNNPFTLAYDSVNSRLFVGESANNRLVVYSVASITNGQNAVDLLGQYDGTSFTDPVPVYTKSAANDGPNKFGISAPTASAIDASNQRLFLCDANNARILVYAIHTNGTLIDHVPDNVLGQPDFLSNVSATQQNSFLQPHALLYDSANNRLFVADFGASRVLVFDVTAITNGQNATNILGKSAYNVSTATTQQNGMNTPIGLAYDSTHSRLFVSESSNNRITVYDVASITDGENAVDLLGQYDQTSFTDPVPVYTKSAANDGPNKFGFSTVEFMAYDETGHRLFVDDRGNNRVLVYAMNANGTFVDRIPDNILGQSNYYTNTAASQQNGLNLPEGLAYDSTNNRLFIAQVNGHRVTVYDVSSITDGENATNVLGQPNFTTATAATQQNSINVGRGLAYDSVNNRLFVVQGTGNRVTVYDVSSITDGENATNVLGQPNFTTATAATQQNSMNAPTDVSYDSTNNRLFVAQTSANRITVYDVLAITNGENATNVLGQPNFTTATAAIQQNGLSAPFSIAYDSANNRLFATTTHRVFAYDVAAITDGENATNVLGQADFITSTSSVQQNGLNFPQGLAYSSTNGLLFVANGSSGNRVTVYDVASITDGENAVDLLGQYNETSFTNPVPLYNKGGANNGPNKFGMNAPRRLALDTVNYKLYVADAVNSRILAYALNTDGTFVDHVPDNVLGQSNYYTSTSTTQQNGMNAPVGIAYDSANNRLFVGESSNRRVVSYDVTSITDGENATVVLGKPDFLTSTASVQQNGLGSVNGVEYDSLNNRLLVADNSGNRVLFYDVDPTSGASSSSSSSSTPVTTTASTTVTPAQSAGGSRGGSTAQRILQATEALTHTPIDKNEPATNAEPPADGRLFHDVPSSSWFAPYISTLITHGIAEGYRDATGNLTGDFGPANPVTKAEMLKMILNITDNVPDFSKDLIPQNYSARNTWAAPYVMKAEILGLSVFPEYPDTMDVHVPATRGEVIQTLIEAMKLPHEDIQASSFSDVPSTHPYAKAISLAAALHLISGDTDKEGNLLNTFRPDVSINRAETAKMMVKAMEFAGNK